MRNEPRIAPTFSAAGRRKTPERPAPEATADARSVSPAAACARAVPAAPSADLPEGGRVAVSRRGRPGRPRILARRCPQVVSRGLSRRTPRATPI